MLIPLWITASLRRWNEQVISPLVEGAVSTMIKYGAKRENIVIESIPGSYELPIACSRCATRFHAATVHRARRQPRGVTVG